MKIKYLIWNLCPKFIKKKVFNKILGNNNIQFGSFDLTDFFNKRIILGENIYIGENVKIFTSETTMVNIGKYVSIASGCRIITYNHGINFPSPHINQCKKRIKFSGNDKSGDINIGNDVWIGFNCIILAGVTIGDGAVIGAGAIVSKNIEPYSIVVGNPGIVVKKRFREDIINFLLDIKWWNWTDEKIKLNSYFFNTDLNSYNGNIIELLK